MQVYTLLLFLVSSDVKKKSNRMTAYRAMGSHEKFLT